MYYEDLTTYQYSDYGEGLPGKKVISVGWLDAPHPYPRGRVPYEFLLALSHLCVSPVNHMRGFHSCSFCLASGRLTMLSGMMLVRTLTGKRYLGSAELCVPGEDDVVYMAPNLIYHYVAEHEYRPPDEFIAAAIRVAGRSTWLRRLAARLRAH